MQKMSLRANSFVISRIGSQNALNTDGAKRFEEALPECASPTTVS
jgi:hypothetical protein